MREPSHHTMASQDSAENQQEDGFNAVFDLEGVNVVYLLDVLNAAIELCFVFRSSSRAEIDSLIPTPIYEKLVLLDAMTKCAPIAMWEPKIGEHLPQ